MILLSLGCGQEECAEGFELLDERCYEVETSETDSTPTTSSSTTPPDPMDLLREGWDPCDVSTGDGTMDLDGCALGVCAGETYADAVVALGEADLLDATYDPGYVFAEWVDQVSTWYPDLDLDGVPDVGGLATWLTVYPAADTTTEDGLGPGVSMTCFVDLLGEPEQIELEYRSGDWEIVALEWWYSDVKVWDYYDRSYDQRGDGEADFIYLSY